MASQDGQQYFGKVLYSIADESITPDKRSLFGTPPKKEVAEERVELHDFRTADDVVKGPKGLDVQGFTYINHRSALSNADQFVTGRNVEDVYVPEVEELVRQITGARTAVVNNVAFRRKLAKNQEDHSFYHKKGGDLDQRLSSVPKDTMLVFGKVVDESLEPLRMAHVDFTLQGLRDSVRCSRTNIQAAAQTVTDAEDQGATDVPRYAVYSVWRPIKTVKRDPLIVCDWRTVDTSHDLDILQYRAPSHMLEKGEYIANAYNMRPPKHPIKHKWYWMPEQKEDEVLIVKFADTESERNPDVAAGCPHVSPKVEGMKDEEEPRQSIECRVFAFW